MSSLTRLVINSTASAEQFKGNCNLAPGGLPAANNFADYLSGLIGGTIPGASLSFKVGAVQATGTVTISSMVADDTVTVAGVVLTAKAADGTGANFIISGSPTNSGTAAALAAKINAYAPFAGIVTATALNAVVTVTAVVPGLIGNAVGLAISAHGSVSGALLTGGTDGTAYSVDLS